jgi:excinuclease ABC subunit B
MRAAIDETNRRRQLQMEFNDKHGIVPATIRKAVRNVIEATHAAEKSADYVGGRNLSALGRRDKLALVQRLRKEMADAAKGLEFERAATLRDMILELESAMTDGSPAGAGATDATEARPSFASTPARTSARAERARQKRTRR